MRSRLANQLRSEKLNAALMMKQKQRGDHCALCPSHSHSYMYYNKGESTSSSFLANVHAYNWSPRIPNKFSLVRFQNSKDIWASWPCASRPAVMKET